VLGNKQYKIQTWGTKSSANLSTLQGEENNKILLKLVSCLLSKLTGEIRKNCIFLPLLAGTVLGAALLESAMSTFSIRCSLIFPIAIKVKGIFVYWELFNIDRFSYSKI
jgi:hypothetical protein